MTAFDNRWTHGMNGWRVEVHESGPEHLRGREGEVTGYVHAGRYVYVVLDGSSEPIKFYWYEVRPA